MRMAFGLVAVLVTLGVIVLIMSEFTLPSAKVALQQKKQAEATLGALTSSGLADSKGSIALGPVMKSNRLDGLKVRQIVTGGAMEVHYGLMRNDVIIGVAGNTFDAIALGDQELAESLVWEARGKQQALMVLRNGKKIELPWQPAPEPPPGGGAGANGAGANAGGANGGGANAGGAGETQEGPRKESPLSRQVRIATH